MESKNTNGNLIVGLEFASKYELTTREMQTLIPFLKKNYTRSELATELGVSPITLAHIIQRLKMKGLIGVISRDTKGNLLYGFNTKVLNS